MNQSKGGSEWGKTWSKHSKKKGQINKNQKQQKSDNKVNGNGYTKIKNGVHLVDDK